MNVGILVTEHINCHKYSVIETIAKLDYVSINGVYVDSKKPLSRKETLWKNIKRGRGLYIVVMMVNKFLTKKNKKYSVKDLFDSDIIHSIESLCSESAIRLIESNKHDVLILINGYGIIKKPILEIAPKGVLSYHHGDIRKYRGMPPLFWEYYYGEKKCGATVQRLSEKLDAGEIMAETSVNIDYSKSFQHNKEMLYKKSELLMAEALEKVSKGERGLIPDSLGNVYTLPNFREWIYILIVKLKYKL